ncbi:hypothetical protein EUGRSUZ_G02149 [Eucalyptus grandis]|uniref:3'-5' exonuclease domain-containing protein n=2 Tax=Eucalyptus grandis TaxID=71139 RepID=A0A059BEK3_EUCGR|nr:hypothetical protein EUGRSUZ_G02149 [Eucalyptus grandis]
MPIVKLVIENTHSFYKVFFQEHTIEVMVTSTPSIASSWLSNLESRRQRLVVGLDAEWVRQDPLAILQLSTGNQCLLFQILHAEEIPLALKNFLENEHNTFVGVDVDEDVRKLSSQYALDVTNTMDLKPLARAKGWGGLENAGLKMLARMVLGWTVDKDSRVRVSDWNNLSLDDAQVEYACLDAFVSSKIAEELYAQPDAFDSSDESEDEDE